LTVCLINIKFAQLCSTLKLLYDSVSSELPSDDNNPHFIPQMKQKT